MMMDTLRPEILAPFCCNIYRLFQGLVTPVETKKLILIMRFFFYCVPNSEGLIRGSTVANLIIIAPLCNCIHCRDRCIRKLYPLGLHEPKTSSRFFLPS